MGLAVKRWWCTLAMLALIVTLLPITSLAGPARPRRRM